MRNIVILTGAGVSAESGIDTFRDKGGIWKTHNVCDLATPAAFNRSPELVHEFYNARRANVREAEPNAAHTALARLWKEYPGEVTLITQNVDDLHERGGASEVIHMHGELRGALCAACGHRWDAPVEMLATDPCPACSLPRTRPDIVWFGEIPHHMEIINSRVAEADLFASIGTSGSVYPAAGLQSMAAANGAHTVELNLEESQNTSAFEEVIHGRATLNVPDWVERLLEKGTAG